MISRSARPRPVSEISGRQSWWSIGAALVPGLVVLAAALAAGRPITPVELGAAALAVLVPLTGGEIARRRTVDRAEQVVTPNSDPRDAAGRRLRPRDEDLLEQALAEILRERGHGDTTAEPDRPPPTGTREYPAVGTARPMRADDAASARAGARSYEDGWHSRSGDPGVRRGRDVADRRDRVTAPDPPPRRHQR